MRFLKIRYKYELLLMKNSYFIFNFNEHKDFNNFKNLIINNNKNYILWLPPPKKKNL